MLSIYDQTLLPKEDQKKIENLTSELANNPTEAKSIHDAVETIRGQYGYSGGADGSQFVKVSNPQSVAQPEAPILPDFSKLGTEPDFSWNGGAYRGDMDRMLNQVRNMTDEGFQYDPAEDIAFQSFKNEMLRMGGRAYQNDLARMSSATGGYANSWAQSVASQSRNQYMQTATDAIPQFRNQALNEYRQKLNDKLSLLEGYQQAYDMEYREYVNEYEAELTKYQNTLDLAKQQYDLAFNEYLTEVEIRRDKIDEAWERTKTTGYVSNSDASILGLPAGTMSAEARASKEELENYLKKTAIDVKAYKDKLDYEIGKEKEMATWELNNIPSGSGGSGSINTEGVADEYIPEIYKYNKEFDEEMMDIVSQYEGTDMAGNKTNFYDLPEDRQRKIVNAELNERFNRLASILDTTEDAGRFRANLEKTRAMVTSKWFIQYADQTMREEAKGFRTEYEKHTGASFEIPSQLPANLSETEEPTLSQPQKGNIDSKAEADTGDDYEVEIEKEPRKWDVNSLRGI